MENEEYVKCPRCKSRNIAQGTNGYSLGKAAIGGILLGPLGLLAGTHKSKDVKFTCLNCGNKFSVQDYLDDKKIEEDRQRLAELTPEERDYEIHKRRIGCLLLIVVAIVGVILIVTDLKYDWMEKLFI